ncbi:MAG: HAD family hydrolase [Bacillota bacterium]
MQTEYPRKIIFDMDGVITSEECYWNTAALVVWELLFSRRGLGLPTPPELPPFEPAPDSSRVAAIRRVIFQDDRVITFFKRRAVNSNWDLAFYNFAFQLVMLLDRCSSILPLPEKEGHLFGDSFGVEQLPRLGALLASRSHAPWQPDFNAILNGWAGEARGAELGARLHALLPEKYLAAAFPEHNFCPASPLWEGVRRIFQEWYLGENGYEALYGQPPEISGKRGFITDEQPLLPVERVKKTLRELRQRGWVLGIATGRPRNELLPPLEQMGLWPYFDKGSVITFDGVEQAQQAMEAKGEQISLGKPHPFSLLRAYWGNGYPQEALFCPPFPSPPAGNCYLVGDAPADLLAARAAGISFIAVLTGHEGAAGRSLFTGQGATAVLLDITHIPSFLDTAKA